MRILVVEDNAAMRKMLCEILTRNGVRIDTGENCYETRCLLQENKYNWVTLDLGLPDGNGVDILQAIELQYPDTKVAVISIEASDPPLRRRLIDMGAAAVFPKPFDVEELTRCIYDNSGS